MPRIVGGSLAEHRAQSRQRIFDALTDLMYSRGYDAISLADVAAAAGMSRTAIYNYFADKDALLVSYATHETDRYVAELLDALREVENPVDRLRTFIAHQLRYFSTRHIPPGAALRVMLPDQSYHRVLDHIRVLEVVLQKILEAGSEQGYMQIADVDSMMPLVTACINRGGIDEPGSGHIEDDIEVTETFVLRALGVRLSPDGRPRRLSRR